MTDYPDFGFGETLHDQVRRRLDWLHALSERTPRDQREIDFERGQWHAFNRILNYLNTLDTKDIPKKELYATIMEMRPDDERTAKELDEE